MNKKLNKEINKKIEKALNKSMPVYDFDKDNTLLKFHCNKCNSDFEFDVMEVQFDTLHNKEKFLAEPKCSFCGEVKKIKGKDETLAFLAYLYNNNYMKEALFEEKQIKALTEKYPKEEIKDPRGLDDEGLQALEQGNYSEVFRIFTQFIYLNPNHHLGFEFVAYAYYENRDFPKSLYFMEKALERAKVEVEEKILDRGLYSVLLKNYEYMKRKQLIFRWWENL